MATATGSVAAAGPSTPAGALAGQADDAGFERVSLPRAAARAFSQFRAHNMTDHAAALRDAHRGAKAGAYRMCTRRARDRIAVLIFFVRLVRHDVTPCE